MNLAADHIMSLVLDATPALCAGCLVKATLLPEEQVRQAATDLVGARVLSERVGRCPVCQSETRVFRANGQPTGRA